jgi:hypothetical protein
MQKRSKSVKPDLMTVTSSDLRFAFQNFEKKDKFKHGGRKTSLDPVVQKKPVIKGNLIFNEGSEAVIQGDHVEINEPKSTALFIESALLDMINQERLDAKQMAEHSKMLNYPSKPLGLIIDNEELKQRNLSTL